MGYALTFIIPLIILNELNCLGIYSFNKGKIGFLNPFSPSKFYLNVGGKKLIEEGHVTQSMGGTIFQVETKMEKKILCELSGKMKINRIRIDIGNLVVIEMNPRYPNKGRIIKRFYKTKHFGMARQLQNKIKSDSESSESEYESDEYDLEEEDFEEEDEIV